MEAAAASRRGNPNRGRPLVPPNYVSLRHLQELRLKEKEEQRRREEEEAEARRVREEKRKRQEEEEEAAAKRFIEERRRREEEEAAARRARDAAAAPPAPPRPEMRASSSSGSYSFRNSQRARGGKRMVGAADRPPPPPPRGECAAVKIDVATGGCRGQKGPDGGATNAPPGGGFKAHNVEKGKVSAGMVAGSGEPAKPAAASSQAGKPEENSKGEASGCQGKLLLGAMPARTSSASGELAKVGTASYRDRGRPNHRHQGKKGFDGRSREQAMTSSVDEEEAAPLPVVNLENRVKSRSGDQSTETTSASMPGKVAEASPPRGGKSDNKGRKKPSGGRQAGSAPSSDLPDGKKVEASGCDSTTSRRSSSPDEQADAGVASYQMPLKSRYMPKGQKGLDGRSIERATTIVAGKVIDTSPVGGISLEIKGKNGLTEQGTETALARIPGEVPDISLAGGFKLENKGKKESSRGRHTGMAGMKARPCPAAEGSGGQGTTCEAKTEGLQPKQTVVEVNMQPNLAAESSSYLRSSGDQGMIQAPKSEGSEEKQRVVEMRTAARLKPRDMRNSGRQRPGCHSQVNFSTRQHVRVWVPKAAAVPDSAIVGKFP